MPAQPKEDNVPGVRSPDEESLSLAKPSLEDYYAQLESQIDSVLAENDAAGIRSLGRRFLSAARTGVPATIKLYLDHGMSADYQDPQTGQTALHAAASSRARKAIRLLISTGACNFLLRDAQGRLSSEIAFLYGQDPALARLLRIKERKQAQAQGIRLTRRPEPAP